MFIVAAVRRKLEYRNKIIDWDPVETKKGNKKKGGYNPIKDHLFIMQQAFQSVSQNVKCTYTIKETQGTYFRKVKS